MKRQTIPALRIVSVNKTGLTQRQKRINGVLLQMPNGKLTPISVATAVLWLKALVCSFFVVKHGERIQVRIGPDPRGNSYLETFRGTEGTDDLYDLDEYPR
jgi:hypothetical protein